MSLPLKSEVLRKLMISFLREDVGSGDLTTNAIVPASARARGWLIAKQRCVLAGLELLPYGFRVLDPSVRVKCLFRDGQEVAGGQPVASVSGRARALLTGERVALNVLQRLSGIATLTHEFVRAVRGTRARIYDTRKTTPGWRMLEKYAVRCGGGHNHRRGLFDAILIKDNHLAFAGGVRPAVERARMESRGSGALELEVSTVDQLRDALGLGVNHILLDNMTPPQVRRCVELIRKQPGGRRTLVECSGGVSLRSVRPFAEAGADWISVGALTHSAPAVDISFEIEPAGAGRPRGDSPSRAHRN
ncbi:MAG: carboxylating nicotinate-nucleotide diphosphorylase [Acidobacteriia bacterium]|nr:carboxylating nicotinate-nucleotide diphosphorylase [Terriglobia bacterium]